MTEQDDIKEFIYERACELNLQPKDFYERIESSMIERGIGPGIEIVHRSTANRWINGNNEPSPIYYQFIADALEISLEELCKHNRMVDYQVIDKMNEYMRKFNDSNSELQSLISAILLDKKMIKIYAIILLLQAFQYASVTFFGAHYLALVLFIAMLIALKKNWMDFAGKFNDGENDSDVKHILKFLDAYKSGNHVAHITMNYVIITLIMSFLPLLESLFYRGKFYISFIYYLLIGLFLFHRYLNNK